MHTYTHTHIHTFPFSFSHTLLHIHYQGDSSTTAASLPVSTWFPSSTVGKGKPHDSNRQSPGGKATAAWEDRRTAELEHGALK
ncbi:hypothetical protein ILYODFUR_032044 [Ilyodon furcidens]|uniref:Uncharacterized protein n=1 Tax=Ilyodon furcidens TaxID=33524 RepID=A0ABV0T289_9TELE